MIDDQIGALPNHFTYAGNEPDIRFSGFNTITYINDDQGSHPTCFLESVENVLQLYMGDIFGTHNDLATNILDYAKTQNLAVPIASGEWVIPNNYHQALLANYGISTELCDFNHQDFKHYLDQQCPILLGVDSVYFGNPVSGPHSITLVDIKVAENGEWFYRVLDSANPHQEWYQASVVEQAARSAMAQWADGYNGKALICKTPATVWPFRT